jgi:hypothetical protein
MLQTQTDRRRRPSRPSPLPRPSLLSPFVPLSHCRAMSTLSKHRVFARRFGIDGNDAPARWKKDTGKEGGSGRIDRAGMPVALLLVREGRCISIRGQRLLSPSFTRRPPRQSRRKFVGFLPAVLLPFRLLPIPSPSLPLPIPLPSPLSVAITFPTWARRWVRFRRATRFFLPARVPDASDARSHFRWIVFSLLPSQRDGSS